MFKHPNFTKFLETVDQLPIPKEFGHLNMIHLKMIQIIKSQKISRTDLIKKTSDLEASQAQRYRYLNDLINLQIVNLDNQYLSLNHK